MQVINKPSSTVDKYCAVIKNCYGYGRAPLPSPSVASGPREVFPRTRPYLPLYTSKESLIHSSLAHLLNRIGLQATL
ncbi:hypothetical protein WJX82_004989 [Trebouxia sp. C0006]